MARLCGRPGCSEVGAVAYGMVPEDLLFWIAPLADAPVSEPSVLCVRHADAMVVPRGWTLDDRRENALRLFRPPPFERPTAAPRRPARRSRTDRDQPDPDQPDRGQPDRGQPEQLQIDGTGETERPILPDEPAIDGARPDDGSSPAGSGSGGSRAGWEPEFDHTDDLNGLLEVSSPLLARAFRGTDRPPRR